MLRGVLIALPAALIGAATFVAIGAPAGALLGATVVVTALALAGARPRVPALLRDLGFATIGVTLGAGVTPTILSDLARFPVSLLGLGATIAAVMVVSNIVLRRVFSIDPPTAVLATSPGALSYALALSASGRGPKTDAQVVTTLQSLRLLLITLLLPPLIEIIDASRDIALPAVMPHGASELAILPSLVLVVVSAAAGAGLARLGMPAAFLLAGVAVSALAHGLGMVEGRPATELTFVGFALAGAVIGERFGRISRSTLRRLLAAGLAVTAVSVGLSGVTSAVMAGVLGLPFGQVWVSYAPGGVEGMSAMALTLGYDPVYVATHHIVRLLVLIAVLPMVLRRL